MTTIIFSGKITDLEGCQQSIKQLRQTFKKAIDLHEKLVSNKKKIAYFFIDPLLNGFEAANQFYFSVFECESIYKINTYKSGASPVQAVADAKELIECGVYDAVFIFGHEPLLTNKQTYGKEEVAKAMNIFDSHSIIQCYNALGHALCKELELSDEEFVNLSDQLFMNYSKTFERVSGTKVSKKRGRKLIDHQADLFKLTDCANPNIDFSGGIILANDRTVNDLQIPEKEKIKVSGVSYSLVEGSPKKIEKIVGKSSQLFPHLQDAFLRAQDQSNINVIEEFKKGNVYLDVYTCYPPIPIGFLLTTGIIKNISELPDLLEQYEITITGGMNLARAPWNNPALNGLIDMYQKLRDSAVFYGLVHGNGGIGETQGVVLLEKT